MDVGSTEKNGSQRQKLTRKICKNRKVDFNFKLKSALFLCVNFSAVSLTSVLSAPHKNPQKIFSVLVFGCRNGVTRLRIRNAFSDDERYANDRYETVFQHRLHHDLPPQTSYSEKIFTRRKCVAII